MRTVTYDADEFRAAQEEEFALEERKAEAIDRLQRNRPSFHDFTRMDPATDKQDALIDRLLTELHGINLEVHGIAWEWIRSERAAGRMNKDRASEVIARLKRHCGYEEKGWAKRADFVTPAPVEIEGLYRYDGRLYQVMRGRDSNRLHAKLIIFVEGKKRPNLVYAAGMMSHLRPEHLVPTEEAQELTRKTGWCVFGHFLTNPVSIARGMGPTCWERYGNSA